MRVERLHAVPVVEHDHLAEEVELGGEQHPPRRRGEHRRPDRRGDVEAEMRRPRLAVQHALAAVDAADPALRRPGESARRTAPRRCPPSAARPAPPAPARCGPAPRAAGVTMAPGRPSSRCTCQSRRATAMRRVSVRPPACAISSAASGFASRPKPRTKTPSGPTRTARPSSARRVPAAAWPNSSAPCAGSPRHTAALAGADRKQCRDRRAARRARAITSSAPCMDGSRSPPARPASRRRRWRRPARPRRSASPRAGRHLRRGGQRSRRRASCTRAKPRASTAW